MIKAILFPLFLAVFTGFYAQENNVKNTEMAGRFLNLYNIKKYSEIHTLLSPEFKKDLPEKEFITFMDKNIFAFYNSLEKLAYLESKAKYSQFKCQFKNGELLLNLNVNEKNEIDLIQLMQYPNESGIKRQHYLSDNPKATLLDSMIQKAVADYMQSPENCGLSIGIYSKGKEYFYNYGETSRNSGKLPTSKNIYEIGSISKVFCGILLATAIKENKVKASDDIRKYLPEGKYNNLEMHETPIQLVHLANHTSGLPRLPEDIGAQPNFDPQNPYKNYNKEMVFKFLETVNLSSAPGDKAEYSNIGMGLLGINLESVYKKTFEELVQGKICQPLNMTNTAIKLSAQQESLFTIGYNASGNETPHWELPDLNAAGGLRSNAEDMLHFLKANLEQKTEILKLAQQPQLKTDNIAMAWHILKTKQGNTLVWHNGATFGASAFCGFIKEKDCAVIILSNSGTTVDPIALNILRFLQQ